MNNLGQQDVQSLIQSFQRQVCGRLSSNMFVHEYEFHKRIQGSNESFDKFYNDLQTLLNKFQYKDCCQSSTQMSCKNRILLARLVASIKSHDIRKGLLCIQDLTLDKAVKYIQVDETTSSQADNFLTKANKTGASMYGQNNFPRNTGKGDQPPITKDKNLQKCKCLQEGTLSVGIVKTKVTGLNLLCVQSSANQEVVLLILTRKLLMKLLSVVSSLNQLLKSFQLITTTTCDH